MKLTRGQLLRGAFHVALLGLIGYLIFGFPRSSPATVALDGKTYRITGPYTHENLAVYLIHADNQDEGRFITLDEGLKSGVVKVKEKANAQVTELTIENTGDDNLFLQEGDRVQGGQQDRTLYTSLVVPPHSGQMPLPAYCVEPHRWVAGAQGQSFAVTGSTALSPKAIRLAAKVQQDQGQVWAAVADQKQRCALRGLSTNTNSSLNESLDAPKVKRIAEEFAQALNGAIEGQEDAVGVAIVVNGRVEEVNFYPNHQVLTKLYPRLVQSYSLAATLKQKEETKRQTLSDVEVGRFVWASDQGEKKAAVARARPSQPLLLDANMSVDRIEQVRFDELRDISRNQRGSNRSPTVGAHMSFAKQAEAPPQGAMQAQAAGQAQNLQIAVLRPSVNRIAPPQNIRRSEAVNKDNQVEVVEQAAVVNCKTAYHGKVVHRQYLRK